MPCLEPPKKSWRAGLGNDHQIAQRKKMLLLYRIHFNSMIVPSQKIKRPEFVANRNFSGHDHSWISHNMPDFLMSRARDHTLYLFCVQLPGSWKSHGAIVPLWSADLPWAPQFFFMDLYWKILVVEPVWKYKKESVGMMTFPPGWKKWEIKNVPNHQPESVQLGPQKIRFKMMPLSHLAIYCYGSRFLCKTLLKNWYTKWPVHLHIKPSNRAMFKTICHSMKYRLANKDSHFMGCDKFNLCIYIYTISMYSML